MDKSCEQYTTFIMVTGTYQLKEMPFGFMVDLITIQRFIDEVMKKTSSTQACLDSLALKSMIMEEDVAQSENVFDSIDGSWLKLKA